MRRLAGRIENPADQPPNKHFSVSVSVSVQERTSWNVLREAGRQIGKLPYYSEHEEDER